MTRRRWIGAAILSVALLLLGGRIAANAYAEFQWYAAIGALPVWRLRMRTLIVMRAVAFAAWGTFLFLNFYAVRRSVAAVRIPRRMANLEIGEDLPGHYLDIAAVILAVGVGALLAWSYADWTRAALAWNGLPFGEIAPPFELDLGFYLYWLPFETALRDSALVGLIITIGLVGLLYALTPSLRRTGGRIYVSNHVRRHLFVLVALLLMILAWTFRLDAHQTLLGGSGPDGLFTAADSRGSIPANTWLSLLTLAVAALVLWSGWTGQLRIALSIIGLLVVGAVAARQLAPRAAAASAADAARTVASADMPDVAPEHRPYALMRDVYTRRAYAVDRLSVLGDDVRALPAPAAASAISAWDPSALTRGAARLTGGVPHRVGWNAQDGQLDAIIPLAPGGQGGSARSWSAISIAAPLADASGDVIAHTGHSSVDRSRPIAPVRIVDGAQGYLLVEDSSDDIAGPSLDSRRVRFAFAWSAQNYTLLSREAGTRVLLERDPREIVRRLAPFFQQGTTLFPVVERDTLYWVVELYAVSAHYPLSRHFHFGQRLVRYVHHAATAIVNGSNGSVQLVLTDLPEPVTRSWARLVPALFDTWAAVRPSLADALPPAVDGARLQAEALASSGTRAQPEGGGNLAAQDGGAATELLQGDPTLHGILVEQGSRSATAWTVPVLDRQQRLRGAVVAVGGRVHESRYLSLPMSEERWPAIRESLRRALDTLTQAPREARVIHGPVRAAPLPNDLVLVQSAYTWRGDGAPTLLGTAIHLRDNPARVGATIPGALGVAVSPPPAGDGTLRGGQLEARVRALYAAMETALARGDLVAFGAAFDSLGRALGLGPRQ
ncbi:MAG TPA: UPF0182 family protein [Gemmatimonadaceae bacterium]|nr:UPF0182 family protein [Gemmatimonadaceae bacterium]